MRREGEQTWGGVSAHHPTRGLGERHKLPRGLEQSPSRKLILCIYEVRKKPSGTPFSAFLSEAGPPNVAGPEKTPTPSRRTCQAVSKCFIVISLYIRDDDECNLFTVSVQSFKLSRKLVAVVLSA